MSRPRLFGIGLPKSGTTSLGQALRQLGYRTWHNPLELRFETYERGVYRYTRDDWDALTNFGEHFYPELDAAYPSSRFILTVRPAERWLATAERWFSEAAARPELDDWVRVELFGTRRFNRPRFARVYEQHRSGVLRYFAERPSDLLVLEIGAGDEWRRLGEFLGRSPPAQPFPQLKAGQTPGTLGSPPGSPLLFRLMRRLRRRLRAR